MSLSRMSFYLKIFVYPTVPSNNMNCKINMFLLYLFPFFNLEKFFTDVNKVRFFLLMVVILLQTLLHPG